MTAALDGPRIPAAAGRTSQLVVFLHGYGADGKIDRARASMARAYARGCVRVAARARARAGSANGPAMVRAFQPIA